MEILSTGEKIKRARIYKGYTLKELCKEKISVSKMSCIENDKVKAEEWILDFVADILKIERDYLKQDVKEQIEKNIKELENVEDNDIYEKELQYNLKYAEEYGYYDLCFNICHVLINRYLENEELEKTQIILSKYYDYWNKCNTIEREMIYHSDVAKYFSKTKEYIQAANYYKSIRNLARKVEDYNSLAKATYDEAYCYINLKNYERAYEIAVKLNELIEYMSCSIYKAKAYNVLAMLAIRRESEKFQEYEQKSNLLLEDKPALKAVSYKNYAIIMFQMGMNEKALEYLKIALECYPKEDEYGFVEYLLSTINILIENDELEMAYNICDVAVDKSISLNKIHFIEKAYYYKAIILEKRGNYTSSEMYLNLSLDSLLKFANKQEIYSRYIKMGEIYHRMNNIQEALKYFNFAVKMGRKL